MSTKVQQFKGYFYCSDHRKFHTGQGFIYQDKTYCPEAYKKIFPKFIQKEIQE